MSTTIKKTHAIESLYKHIEREHRDVKDCSDVFLVLKDKEVSLVKSFLKVKLLYNSLCP